MKRGTVIFMAAGAAFVVGSASLLYFSSGAPSLDTGGNTLSGIEGNIPNIQNDPLAPVGQEEASRRATFNDQKADELQKQDPAQSQVAPPVIAQQLDLQDSGPLGGKPPEGIDLPQVVPMTEVEIPTKTDVPKINPATQEVSRAEQQAAAERQRLTRERLNNHGTRIQQQVDQLLANNPQPQLNTQFYVAPPKKASTSSTATANGSGKSGVLAGKTILAAKPGDVFYAALKVGFNSDDPRGLPVYATITDQRADGSYGPLHGGVLAGNVTYSQNQAAVTFRQMTLRDGRTAPIQAMAATLDEVRPGVAAKVDKHTLARYGGLVVSSLFQGLGMAGQELLRNDRTTFYSDNYVETSGNSDVDWKKVGLATALPLGNNLANAFSRNFNRPATMSSPAGTEVGIVFLQEVTVQAAK